jgi:16S rRNA processing protein RimM
MTDYSGRFAAGEVLFLSSEPHRLEYAQRRNASLVVVKLEGIDSAAAAEALRGQPLSVPRDRVPSLPQGQYYYFQLLDIEVYTSHGEHLGHISEIMETGSNDVYVVTNGGQELLIPALDDVIQSVDVDARRMVVELPPGLR